MKSVALSKKNWTMAKVFNTSCNVHPGRSTWNLQITMIMVHVILQGCNVVTEEHHFFPHEYNKNVDFFRATGEIGGVGRGQVFFVFPHMSALVGSQTSRTVLSM